MSKKTSTPPNILNRAKELVEPALIEAIDSLATDTALAAKYHFGWVDESGNEIEDSKKGGKGIRPALAVLSAEYVGVATKISTPGAVAVELVHNFSLIHDDVIDKDEERRHRQTVWKAFGIEKALLTGDALLALAFQVLLRADENTQAAVTQLAEATSQMIAGQQLDMAIDSSATVKSCEEMEAKKTGALLACASSIGAILAGAEKSQVESLHTYGLELGLAFQAIDDLLGIWGNPQVTGKPAGNDIRENKRSLPIVIALEKIAARDKEQNAKNQDFPKKQDFLRALNTDKKTESDIQAIVDTLDELCAKEATQKIANRHLESALVAIDEKNIAGKELYELAEFVIHRNF